MSTLSERNDRALGYNYPAGAEHDPRAPWNKSEPEQCDTCEGTAEVDCPECRGLRRDGSCPGCEHGKLPCEDCNSTGEQPQPSAEDIACDKADRAMDADKDREAEEAL